MNKKLKNILLFFISLLILNIAFQKYFKRFDLTSDKRYTLSDFSKENLQKLDKNINIKVYLEGDFPAEFKRLQTETKQFLEELNAVNSNITFQFINPSSIQESLIKKGMIPSQLTVEEEGKLSNEIIFPWAEIQYKNQTDIVNLLSNNQTISQEEKLESAIESLEYSFSNSIYRLTNNASKKIAVLSGNGELEDIYLYSFLSELKKKYRLAKFTLDSVKSNPEKTLNDLKTFDLAIIAKPTERFSENEKLVLDQFIINGGKSIWMIDNIQADTDSLYNQGKMLTYARDLNLTDLFFSYGVRLNTKIVKDLYAAKIPLATGNVGNQTQFQNLDWFYHPLVSGNPNHITTKNILPVRFRFATAIDTLKNSIKKTPLLVSSILTKLEGTPRIIELSSIANEPKQENFKNKYQILGILLEGEFNSAYANRTTPFDVSNFRNASNKNEIVVIADGDIGRNQLLKGKPYDLAIDKWTNQRFGNKDFLTNTVDYLLEDKSLLALKNKNLQIRLLDKQQVFEEKTFWQFLNIVIPLLILSIFGISFSYYRKQKYSK